MSPISRRGFLMTGAAALPAIAAKKAPAPRPNILLIMADDLGAWMLGCYGNKEIRTPNIDLLARAGTRFQNHLVCTPDPAPSRATLLSGALPRQHPADQPMLSDILSGQGYTCGYAGKWDLGPAAQPQHGFKFWQPVDDKAFAGEAITARALGFLDQQKPGQPFFLAIAHPDYEQPPAKYLDSYKDTKFDTIGWQPLAPNAQAGKDAMKDPVASIRRRAAAVTALDDQVPPLLKKLNERGLADSTLLIFTAVNGFLLGRHGLWDSGRGSEPVNMYEEAVATPLIWYWLGKIPVEAVRPEMVSIYDTAPALFEVTGAALPQGRKLPGRSYVPLATNRPLPKKNPWHNLVFGEFETARMVRDKRFKLVLRNQGQGPNELFDRQRDPGEQTNVYDNPSFVAPRDELTKELQGWEKAWS